jgi:hypothetical protein
LKSNRTNHYYKNVLRTLKKSKVIAAGLFEEKEKMGEGIFVAF